MQSDPFSLISDLEGIMRSMMLNKGGESPDLYGYQTPYGSHSVDVPEPLQMDNSTLQQILRPIANCKCLLEGGCKGCQGGKCDCPGLCLCRCKDSNCKQIGWCKPAQFAAFEVASDVYFKDNTFFVCMDLPGVKKEDIGIDLQPCAPHECADHKEKLVVSCTRTICDPKGYLRKERAFGHVSRVFHLPVEALTQKISSKFEDGVLKITIPSEELKTQGQVHKAIPIS